MIIASTGEVSFGDGLRIKAHLPVGSVTDAIGENDPVIVKELPVQGWTPLLLGVHKSDFGDFEVEVVAGSEHRVEGVFLSHRHSFYDPADHHDAERRVFHEGVIASDLRGQHEFSWGHVFCRLDKKANTDWLVLIYNPFAGVPLHAREVYKQLFARETPSGD